MSKLLDRMENGWSTPRWAFGRPLETLGHRISTGERTLPDLDEEFDAGHRMGFRAGRRDGAAFVAEVTAS